MKCTAKNIFGAFQWNSCPRGRVHLPCPCHFTHYLCQAFPDRKYVKNINMKKNTPLVETSHGQVWYYFEWADLWSDVPPSPHERHLMDKFGTTSSRLTPDRDILWPCVWHLLSHRPDVPPPLVETSHGHIWYYCEQADLQSEVPSHMRHQARFAFGQMSGEVNTMSDETPCLKKLSGHGKMIDPHGWLLHHKRPSTWEGNYLIVLYVASTAICVTAFVNAPASDMSSAIHFLFSDF